MNFVYLILVFVAGSAFARDVKVKDPAKLRMLLSVCAEGQSLSVHNVACTRGPEGPIAECHFKCGKMDHDLTGEQATAVFEFAGAKSSARKLSAREITCTPKGCQLGGVM